MSDSHTKSSQGFFDELAEDWDLRYKTDPAMQRRLTRFSEALLGRVSKGAHILDFGCGVGHVARHLENLGYKITAIDLSNEMISQAKAASKGVNIDWRPFSGQGALEFADNSFDAVISSSVLEYVEDLDGILREFRRVLRDGGALVVTVPDLRHAHRRKEGLIRACLSLPGGAALLRHTRWREGAEYLRLSCNRFSLETWGERLSMARFTVEPFMACDSPLAMLNAKAR